MIFCNYTFFLHIFNNYENKNSLNSPLSYDTISFQNNLIYWYEPDFLAKEVKDMNKHHMFQTENIEDRFSKFNTHEPCNSIQKARLPLEKDLRTN